MSIITEYPHGTFGYPGFCSGDADSSKAFYSALLGWEPVDYKMPQGEYTMYKLYGEPVAGMYQMAPERKAAGVVPHWNSYVAVDNVVKIAKQTELLGGVVLTQPFAMEDEMMANLQDPTGAKFSVWQPKQNPERARLNEVGALCWTELLTRGAAKAAGFYTELLNWSAKPFEGSQVAYTIFERESDNKGVGGMMEMYDEMKGMHPQWIPYFQVEDTDEFAELTLNLGGTVHGPFDIPTVGRIAMIQDVEGAGFAVINPICV